MRQVRIMLAAYCAAVPLSLCAFGQIQPASISGAVVDAQGRRIAAAHVFVVPQGSAKKTETTTDLTGHFNLPDLKSGEYSLVIKASGFQSLAKVVVAGPDTNLDQTFTLQIASAETTVNVKADREGYTVPTTDTGNFTPIRILDLPQSVQVVNRELIDEQKAFQFGDVVTYLAGVQRAHAQINGAIGNMLSIRGFILDTSNNYLRDGYKFFGVGRSDTANIEEVEVLKGPASTLYGTAEAGGMVNLVTKKPTNTPYVALAMTGGSYTFLRPEFDISGPLDRSNKLFYRLEGVYEDTNSFRQYIHSGKEVAAPYFLWKPTSATNFAAFGELINVNRNSDYGIPIYGNRPAPVPISTNYGEPWNNEEDRDRQLGLRANHDFRSGWVLSSGFQLSRVNANYFDVYTSGADPKDPTELVRYSNKLYFPYLYRYSRTNLIGQAKTGRITHHIAVGFELGWQTATSGGPGGYAPDVSILHPQIGTDITQAQGQAAVENPYFVLTYTTACHNQGLYAQDQLDLGRHFKAIVGVRWERYFQDAKNFATNTHQHQTNYAASPRAGLVYEPRAWLSVYGSYVQSFIPTSPSAVNRAGNQFSPEDDHQWEGGVKAASPSGRVSSTNCGLSDRQEQHPCA